jgi:hypothetical protein
MPKSTDTSAVERAIVSGQTYGLVSYNGTVGVHSTPDDSESPVSHGETTDGEAYELTLYSEDDKLIAITITPSAADVTWFLVKKRI